MKHYFMKYWPIYVLTSVIFVSSVFLGNKTVMVMADNAPITRHNTIVIDAGHGGEDGGATSCSGRLESQFNLDIALRLNDLCHLLGYDTLMIRSTDISVYTDGNSIAAKKASDLRQRTHIVNSTPNAILISIHQNTFSDNRYSGAQVFYAQTQGSKELAVKLQELFMHVDSSNHRQAKKSSNVYLMQHIQKTGVLVECGFLSNPNEEAKLRSSEYQKMLCCVIVSALSNHINA